MQKSNRKLVLAAGTAAVVLAAGCGSTGEQVAEPAELSSFTSAQELLAAVNGLHGCDAGTSAEPVIMAFEEIATLEYAMCTDTLQVIRFASAEDRITVSGKLAEGAENGPAGIAEGSNWYVFPLLRGPVPSEEDMRDLAYELGGRYLELPAG
ncbi:hypothetical protein ACWGQ2_12605 [Arthrobacter sp. NPDC055585]